MNGGRAATRFCLRSRSEPIEVRHDQPHGKLVLQLEQPRLDTTLSVFLIQLSDVDKMEDKIASVISDQDYWASPTTQIFAFIGLFWVSLKILSFWRMIVSLFILPGVNVSEKSYQNTRI